MDMSGTLGRDAKNMIQLDDDNTIYSVAFAEDEKHIFCGSQGGVLRIDDARIVEPTTLEANGPVYAVVVSKDGRWIVTGEFGRIAVWDARTHKKVYEMEEYHVKRRCVSAVDVSEDSAKVASGSDDRTVRIFDITSRQRLIDPILHDSYIIGVKFSPNGERIATAAVGCGVQVFNVYTGVQLFHIPIPVDRNPSKPLSWSTDGHKLFAVVPGRVACLGLSDKGPLTSHTEWAIQNSTPLSIVHCGRFIACSAGSSVSFWDPKLNKQLAHPIVHSAEVRCIATSSDGRYLVCGTKDQKIVVHDLSEMLAKSWFTISLPLMSVTDTSLQSWTKCNYMNTEVVLSEEIAQQPCHDAYANRALVRARLKRWDAAMDDATTSLKIKPSPIGHIALALALMGQKKQESALWAFDLVFRDCNHSENNFLLLIKSILLYVSGERNNAIARVCNLIPPGDNHTAYSYIEVLAHMYLNTGYYEDAIKSFQYAQLLAPPYKCPHLMTITLIFGEPFELTDISAQQRVCESLYLAGYTSEAARIFLKMGNSSSDETRAITDWMTGFTKKCVSACEHNGDAGFDSANHKEAISQYTAALSLKPLATINLLLKRSRVHAAAGLWDDALCDACKATEMNPSSLWGYERRHAALYGAQRYDEAIGAYSNFLSVMENSQDAETRQLRQTYMSPEEITMVVDEKVSKVSKSCPFVLIDITSGRLCQKTERTHMFHQSQTFKKLVSSMTRTSDYDQILQAVAGYFGYVMLSHAWEGEEPSFQDVNLAGSIWNLDASASPLHAKLREFCKEVRRLGHLWAWSDTCCIDKETSSESIVNQSLTLMYQWYENSAATLVFLANIEPGPNALTDSLWITRSWTLQELLAPKVVRFYDRDWNPYLGDMHINHKESGVIMRELSRLMGIPPETIITFHPDHLTVREKLRLASTRNAREEEDEAYCLIGIFQSDIRPKYGEGKAALGNLLQEIVARTGDVTVLAWNGTSSPFNSCLPLSLAVYSKPPYTREKIALEEMERRVMELRASGIQKDHVLAVYHKIMGLPSALYKAQENTPVYLAEVSGLDKVEFKTADLLPLDAPRHLIFAHPWICDIRGTHEIYNDMMDVDSMCQSSMEITRAQSVRYIEALQVIACLERPFNALILAKQPRGEFKRVATENMVIVRGLSHHTSLMDICVKVIEIL